MCTYYIYFFNENSQNENARLHVQNNSVDVGISINGVELHQQTVG